MHPIKLTPALMYTTCYFITFFGYPTLLSILGVPFHRWGEVLRNTEFREGMAIFFLFGALPTFAFFTTAVIIVTTTLGKWNEVSGRSAAILGIAIGLISALTSIALVPLIHSLSL